MDDFSFSDSLRKDVQNKIEECLSRVGIMFRIFSRNKSRSSLKEKLSRGVYGEGRKIQDSLGVRVVLYFNDDIEIVHKILNNIFVERKKDHSIDVKNDKEFSAIRYNVVYEIPMEVLEKEYRYKKFSKVIDSTFELQIRSMLSEGWHEVEHDLRYKSKNDWDGYDYISRKLNGVYATLETSEWGMVKIFDDLAYAHYKNNKWESMLRQKFRIRIEKKPLNDELINYLNENKEVAKSFFRLSRSEVVYAMALNGFSLPISLNSLVYFCNIFYIKDSYISSIVPEMYKDEFGGVLD